MLAETQHPYDLYSQQQLLERPLEPWKAIAIDPPRTPEVDDAIHVSVGEDDAGKHANITVYVADAAAIANHEDLFDRAADLGFSRYERNPEQLMLPAFVLEQLSLGTRSEIGAPAIAIRIRADEAKTTLLGIERVRVHVRATTYDGYAKLIRQGHPTAIGIARSTTLFRHHTRTGKPYAYKNESHRIVADYMLLANALVAEDAKERKLPWIFRNYAEMSRGKKGGHYSYAEYSTEPLPHACVGGGKSYCHFTSPLRRIVDSANHAVRVSNLEGLPTPYGVSQLEELSTRVNKQMRRFGSIAMTA